MNAISIQSSKQNYLSYDAQYIGDTNLPIIVPADGLTPIGGWPFARKLIILNRRVFAHISDV